MQTIKKKLSELIQPEKNIRTHTKKQLQEFEKSVHMFGQIRPIVIDENNIILAGNGLYETLQNMQYEEAECYQYTNLSENQKKKLMIADNKIFSLGLDNLDTLNEFIEELQGDLEIPGFDEEVLQQMISSADEITEKIVEYGTLDEEEIQNIKESKERREQKVIESPTYTHAENVTEAVPEALTQKPITIQKSESSEVENFVVCPKCGEKIWL